jgi:hypothetical protein
MLSPSFNGSLSALAVTVGLLAISAPVGAAGAVVTDNKDPDKLRGAS